MVAVVASIRGRINRGFLNVFTKRDSVSIRFDCLVQNEAKLSTLITAPFVESLHYMTDSSHHRNCRAVTPTCKYYTSLCFSSVQKFDRLNHQARYMSNASVELSMDRDVVRFSVNKPSDKNSSPTHGKKKTMKRIKMSRKAKRNELRFFRLKAKKKMNSPNPEVRIRYKLEKAKRKEAWLIEKLRKFEIAKVPEETQDPEMLTEEERHFLKRTGEKKKNYVPVGRRGVFGGVVLNMHLHWKKHETVKVVCKPCKPGQIHGYAEELTRLSKGIVIDIKANNTIIFYRGKNYVQPEIMSPPNTLSKDKALEKYRYEQSLEHTSEFIEKLEKELEEYHKHVALYKKGKEDAMKYSPVGT